MYFFFAITCILGCQSTHPPPKLQQKIDLQGHRGARGLAPENTLPGFEEALRHKMHTIELDTVLTKDNQLIIHHDTHTNPDICQTKSGQSISSQPIRQVTTAVLKTFDCGSLPNSRFPQQKRVPQTELMTLGEFFTWGKQQLLQHPRLQFNIEVKFPAAPNPQDVDVAVDVFLTTVRQASLQKQIIVQSFYLPFLDKIALKNPDIRRSALYMPTTAQAAQLMAGLTANRDDIIQDAHQRKVHIISPYHYYVNADFIAKAHQHKLLVIPWTVNEKDRMQELLQVGVDGVISDYPDRLRQVYEELRQPASHPSHNPPP